MKEICEDIGMLGASLAMVISWSINHSIGWAILHGAVGWLYVIYYGICL